MARQRSIREFGSIEKVNLLPSEGEAYYHGQIFEDAESDVCYQTLLKDIAWEHDEIKMFGKTIITKRKVAWYGEQPYKYTYSNVTKSAIYWTPTLQQIKDRVEEASGETYNSCLLNLYHDGSEGMSWHSDDEKELKPDGAIASVSFGAERKFVFKHKQTGAKAEIFLHHGSLLVMKGKTQTHWLHRLPPTKKIQTPRINLTFRTIIS